MYCLDVWNGIKEMNVEHAAIMHIVVCHYFCRLKKNTTVQNKQQTDVRDKQQIGCTHNSTADGDLEYNPL